MSVITLNNTPSHAAGVNMTGLMSVLSQHLYSTPAVGLRELVQNAHDAIIRRRLESQWDEKCEIRIWIEANKRIRIQDTGSGLTEEEIHQYLATVGVGYTRKLRTEDTLDNDNLIGMFGLGFLSAFVLAKCVTVNTASYQTPDKAFQYYSSNAEKYEVKAIPPRDVGTEIILDLRDEFLDFASISVIQDVLELYCVLLKESVYINDNNEPINNIQPPWRTLTNTALHPKLKQKQEIEFASKFEGNFAPICCIPVDIPDLGIKGLFWLQDGRSYNTSDNRNLSVFVRGMLLDSNAYDLLPSWAGFIGGIIESNNLTPTASRETLQKDQVYYQTQYALVEALINGIANLALDQPEAWRRVLARHNEALLGASLCDDRLFHLLQDSLKIATNQGDLTANQLRVNNKLHVILNSKDGFESILFKVMGVPVAYGERYAVTPFLRRYSQEKNIPLIELGTEQGNRKLFHSASVEEKQRQWLTENLVDDEELILAKFSPQSLPLIVVPNREAELKQKLESDEADKKMSVAALTLARHFTQQIKSNNLKQLYINLENPLITGLLQATKEQPQKANEVASLLKSFKVIISSLSGYDTQLGFDYAFNQLTNTSLALLKE